MIAYCACETPLIDVEHDAGCQRCGLPVDFSPKLRGPYKGRVVEFADGEPGVRVIDGERFYSAAWL